MDEVGSKTLEIMRQARWYNNWLVSCVELHIRGDILEVGAGIGIFTPRFEKKGNVWAIDISKAYVKRLQKQIGQRAGFGDIEKGEYFFKNKQSLKSKDYKKFDTIVCLNVLEHTRDDDKALSNMYKLLKPDGKLILLVPSHQVLYGTLDKNLGHARRYNKNLLRKKIENTGFRLVDLKYLNWLGAIGWFINARILKRRIISKYQVLLFDKLARLFLLIEKLIEPPFGLSVLTIAVKK